MGKDGKIENVILLFDSYSSESRNLHKSFKMAGKKYTAVVIEDDGFLPNDTMSLFGSFLGKEEAGKPRYFNQIAVPDYWEIAGNNSSAKVYDMNKERARIFYAEPAHKRNIKVVDWLDDKGVVRVSDHYNKKGRLYAKTIFNAKGKKVNKSYFDVSGKEIIVRNFVTGDIILNDGEVVRIFKTLQKFVEFFVKKNKLEDNRIFYNSLSTPFFVSHSLETKHNQDILFWNEPIGEEIPGNMKLILEGNSPRTSKIMVQRKDAYEKLIKLNASKDIIEKLGYCYDFKKENRYSEHVLICTNSDNIEQCTKFVEKLPHMHFHIAAITEMSSKLMNMGSYENVTLYPSVKMDIVKDLFKKCDYYFDINHGTEILSAVWTAFLHNHLIFAFKETVHNSSYISDKHIYSVDDADRMIADIIEIHNDKSKIDEHIKIQKVFAMCEDASKYENL